MLFHILRLKIKAVHILKINLSSSTVVFLLRILFILLLVCFLTSPQCSWTEQKVLAETNWDQQLKPFNTKGLKVLVLSAAVLRRSCTRPQTCDGPR